MGVGNLPAKITSAALSPPPVKKKIVVDMRFLAKFDIMPTFKFLPKRRLYICSATFVAFGVCSGKILTTAPLPE